MKKITIIIVTPLWMLLIAIAGIFGCKPNTNKATYIQEYELCKAKQNQKKEIKFSQSL